MSDNTDTIGYQTSPENSHPGQMTGPPYFPPMPDVETNLPGLVDYSTGMSSPQQTITGQPGTNMVTVTSPAVTYGYPNTDTPSNMNSGQKQVHQEAWTLPVGEANSAAYSWPDSPDTDVVDNRNAKEPTYQMTQALQAVPGYETTNVRKGKPHTKPNVPVPNDFAHKFERLPEPLSKLDVKEGLKQHVSHQCCHGKRAANDIEIEQVINIPIHQYKLRTFTETRQTIRVYEPFKGGQKIDRLGNTPPKLWEVNNNPDALWKKHSKTCTVPNSSTIETCHGCTGRGFNRCYRCKGRGTTLCKKCKGRGKIKEVVCVACSGSGHPKCQLCRGHACIVCSVCKGNRQLHFYINIISTFGITESEIWLNQTKVPNKYLHKLHKIKVTEMESMMVSPIVNYLIGDVNSASDELMSKHSADATKRVIQQFHVLFAIPTVEAKYDWRRKTKSFWVYGEENRVYAPDYPESCCGRCTIV